MFSQGNSDLDYYTQYLCAGGEMVSLLSLLLLFWGGGLLLNVCLCSTLYQSAVVFSVFSYMFIAQFSSQALARLCISLYLTIEEHICVNRNSILHQCNHYTMDPFITSSF